MINFARSGGTLLNRCLAALPNCVVISEVNPLGGGWGTQGSESPVTIADQANYYYNIKIHKGDFLSEALELHSACLSLGKTLIIRDWSFVNFVPYIDNNYKAPNRLLALELLQKTKQVRPFAFVRDAIDVWISRKTPQPKQFFSEYSRFVDAIIKAGMPIYKYEDLCADSDKFMKSLCNDSGITFSENYKHFAMIKNIHGDVQNKGFSRTDSQIKPQVRQFIFPWKLSELEKCRLVSDVNAKLGYPCEYNYKKTETLKTFLFRNSKVLFKKWMRV